MRNLHRLTRMIGSSKQHIIVDLTASGIENYSFLWRINVLGSLQLCMVV